MYVDLVNKSKDSGHFVPLGISHHGPGGTKTSRGSGASLFLWEVPEPSCGEAWDMFPGKIMPRTPRQLLEKPGALPGNEGQVCGCVGGLVCSLGFSLALCGASGQKAWPGLRSGIAEE